MHVLFEVEGEGFFEGTGHDDRNLAAMGLPPIPASYRGIDRDKRFREILASVGWCEVFSHPRPRGNDYTGMTLPKLATLDRCMGRARTLGVEPTGMLTLTAPEVGILTVPPHLVAGFFSGAPDWLGALDGTAEQNAGINVVLDALRQDPGARDMRVFGSLAAGKPAPADVDLSFATLDGGMGRRIHVLAKRHRGLLDPFDMSVPNCVLCMDGDLRGWIGAKGAKALRAAAARGTPLVEVADLASDARTLMEAIGLAETVAPSP